MQKSKRKNQIMEDLQNNIEQLKMSKSQPAIHGSSGDKNEKIKS